MKATKKEKNSRAGMLERMSKGLDIDCDMLCRGFCAELRGRNRVEICGVRRILTYTDTEVSFVTSEGIFTVSGKRLYCASYKRGAVIVEGCIISLCFDNGGENGAV